MKRAGRSDTLDAAGTATVVFQRPGTTQLGQATVAMQLDGLVVDSQRRLSLAELPAWPDLQPATDSASSRPGAVSFWRGNVYFIGDDGCSVWVRDCNGGIDIFVDLGELNAFGTASDLVSVATTLHDTLLVVDHGDVREFDLVSGAGRMAVARSRRRAGCDGRGKRAQCTRHAVTASFGSIRTRCTTETSTPGTACRNADRVRSRGESSTKPRCCSSCSIPISGSSICSP